MTARFAALPFVALCAIVVAACAPLAPSTVAAVPKPLPVQSAAATDSPAPGTVEYRLGPGDVIKISVYDNPDLATETELSQTGRISLPLVGEVALGGLTRSGAEQAIAERLATGGFVRQPHVTILITQYRSQQVSVLGEVNKPGQYAISHPVGMAEALAMAGGITSKGSQRVRLIQKAADGSTRTREVDVRQLLDGAGAAADVRVGSGDIINVPPMPLFYIYGEVRTPGAYPLAPDMTVSQALSLGGGLTVRGTRRGIQIDRKIENGAVRTLDARLNDRLRPDDVVQVPESWF